MDCETSEDIKPNKDDLEKPAIILKLKTSRYLKLYGCSVCPCSYTQPAKLKYHIRREHFNLSAKINRREEREINEVWLEKVNNSAAVIEIKKTGLNKYLMKKSDADGDQLAESEETLDLMPLYPDCGRVRIKKTKCCICKCKFTRSDYKTHLEIDHEDVIT